MTSFSEEVARRIRAVCGDRSMQEIGRLTGTHPETVRRYLRGLTPARAEFLASVASTFGVSAEWLLHERGSQTQSGVLESALRAATTRQLTAALAQRLDEIKGALDSGRREAAEVV